MKNAKSKSCNCERCKSKNEKQSVAKEVVSPQEVIQPRVAGTTLSAFKTATGFCRTTYGWDITKQVDQSSWNLFEGDQALANYIINVTKDAGATVYGVSGQISVTNGGAVTTENLTIVDQVEYKIGTGQFIDLPGASITFYPAQLSPGETGVYNYEILFTPVQDAIYRNVAHITITNHSGNDTIFGTPFGPDPKADFSLSSQCQLVNDCVHVNDPLIGINNEVVCNSTILYGSKLFSCANHGTNINTVMLTGDNNYQKTAMASVAINCYSLDVSKTAFTSFTRTWNWTVNKVANPTSLILQAGECFNVNYSINASATYVDSDFNVHGTITVRNPAPIPAMINNVTDLITCNGLGAPIEGVLINNPPSFPLVIPAGDSVTFDYSASIPSNAACTNTATAILQNYQYNFDDEDGVVANPIGTSEFSGSVMFSFSNANITEVNKCAIVHDSNINGPQNVQVCAPNSYSTQYISSICGDCENANRTEVNVVTLSSAQNQSIVLATASASVNVTTACVHGCTLTQGYWKTHSVHGPARFPNDTWYLLPQVNNQSLGPETPFFLSGQTWYQVFLTNPAGNPYYVLAHQYMAAVLNKLAGADSTAADACLAFAVTFFNKYTPAQANALRSTNADRKQALNCAVTLDKYNNGIIGPGHCSE